METLLLWGVSLDLLTNNRTWSHGDTGAGGVSPDLLADRRTWNHGDTGAEGDIL